MTTSHSTLLESSLKSLKFLHRGKVRDLYAVGEDRLLVIQTDRLSAFDVIMPDPIPEKGRVLTEMSLWWFKKLGHVIPNHLTGVAPESVVAAKTTLPVLAVPIPSKHLGGLDSLLSMVQMPKGIPVATFAIGDGGSANAGLFAVAILALEDKGLAQKLTEFRKKQTEAVKAAKLPELK